MSTTGFGRLRRRRGYVVCATPRSGSNLLCQLLAGTGVLGVPREYLNGVGRRTYDDPDYPDDPHLQLAEVLSTGSTANGVYAVKIHPFQLRPLLDDAADPGHPVDPFVRLPRVRAVRLSRRDGLGQALSWARAQQSGQYRAGDPAQGEVRYDRAFIDRSWQFLRDEDAFWTSHLRRHRTRVAEVAYEDLVHDPQAQVDRVARFLGVAPAPVAPGTVTVSVQRDDVTDEWRRRYLAESRG